MCASYRCEAAPAYSLCQFTSSQFSHRSLYDQGSERLAWYCDHIQGISSLSSVFQSRYPIGYLLRRISPAPRTQSPPLRDCQPRVFNQAPACDSFGVRVIVNTPPDSQYAIRSPLIVCSFIQGARRLNFISEFLVKEAMICFSTKIGSNGSRIDVLFCTAFSWFTS